MKKGRLKLKMLLFAGSIIFMYMSKVKLGVAFKNPSPYYTWVSCQHNEIEE